MVGEGFQFYWHLLATQSWKAEAFAERFIAHRAGRGDFSQDVQPIKEHPHFVSMAEVAGIECEFAMRRMVGYRRGSNDRGAFAEVGDIIAVDGTLTTQLCQLPVGVSKPLHGLLKIQLHGDCPTREGADNPAAQEIVESVLSLNKQIFARIG